MNRAPVARSVRIEHLDPDFKKANVVKIFEHFGVVESCRTQSVKDNRGRVKSITAYATYRSAVGASKAAGALNGQKIGDRRVLVCFDPRADREHEPQQQHARMVVARNAGQAGSRHSVRDSDEDDDVKRTTKPFVVDGARQSGRRRRDLESRDRRSSSEDEADSDASDEEREARRRNSPGRNSSEDEGESTRDVVQLLLPLLTVIDWAEASKSTTRTVRKS